MTIAEEIRSALVANIDEGYRDFHAKLVPTIDPARYRRIRHRIPLRAVGRTRAGAKAFKKDARLPEFLAMTAHDYVEEINVHGFLVAEILDADACLAQINHFLPMIDNWANCDSFSPKLFKKHPELVEAPALAWMQEKSQPYTVRFGINMLMEHCLDAEFRQEQLAAVADCACDEYYVNMGVAWYFSVALVKQWEATLPWIAERRMPEWVHRKIIQKAVESRRISPEQKVLLKSYR